MPHPRASRRALRRAPENGDTAAMKIATFNVNSIRRRLPNLLAWLEREQPDIACLQELKSLDADFPAAALEAAGYHAVWKGQKSWNGVAILSRGTPPERGLDTLPGDDEDTQSRWLEAKVGALHVACLYLPNGNPQPGPKFDYKLAWFARLHVRAAQLVAAKHPVVLAGDYNVVPTPFDIYPTKSFDKDALVQPESRAAYRALLEQGWVDAIRTLHPDAPMYTFWDYMRQRWPRDAGLRIDHLLLNPVAAKRLQSAGVDRWVRGEESASDHAPAWVTLSR
jgi:exodeoxyribonuclease III